MLLPFVAQVDAAVVVVIGEEAQAVLVVEGRTFASLTDGAMALGAVRLIKLGRLVVNSEGIRHQVLVGAGLRRRLPVAVMADDASGLVDAQAFVLAGNEAGQLGDDRLVG